MNAKNVAAVVLAGAVISGLILYAQAVPDVTVTVEKAPIVAFRDPRLRITVQIPEGYFVPAETIGDFQGAWLQTSYTVFKNPTYPTPEIITLSTRKRVLAYRRTIVIVTPVSVDPRMSRVVPLRFGFQLCTDVTCSRFSIKDANVSLAVTEPSPVEEHVAFRVDASRVAVVTQSIVKLTPDAKPISGPSQFTTRLLEIPEGHASLRSLMPTARTLAAWDVGSNGRTYSAVVERQAGYPSSCGDFENSELALILRVTDPDFANTQAQSFVALPSQSDAAPKAAAALGPLNVTLSSSQQRTLESLIDRQIRAVLPWFFAPDQRGIVLRGPERTLSQLLEKVSGRPVYHIEAFRLAPDRDIRLYVRAHWSPGPPPVGITLWARFDGTSFAIENADASVSRFALMGETKDFDLSAQPEYASVILNVAPGKDGWAYVLMGSRGYEGRGVSLLKYSAFGPRDTSAGVGYGC